MTDSETLQSALAILRKQEATDQLCYLIKLRAMIG